jgi:uncharacterized lipoprotein YbaY
VSGAVVVPTGAVLPPDASIVVEIQDVTMEGTVGTPIAEARIPAADVIAGRAGFSVTYDPAIFVETHAYAIVARVDTADAQTILVSIEPVVVINGGAPTTGVQVQLMPLEASLASPMADASTAPAASEPATS